MTTTVEEKEGAATPPRKITDDQKAVIAAKLKTYRKEQGISQDDFASASGVNKAYVNRIERGEFFIAHKTKKDTPISDAHFEAIARTIGHSTETPLWAHFNTPNFIRSVGAFEDARKGDLRAVDGDTGMGKSYACRKYLQLNRANTFVAQASDDLSLKGFMEEVATAIGVTQMGNRTVLRKAIVKRLLGLENPLLIIDEAENFSDNTWGSVKTLIDYVKNPDMASPRRYLCGIVVLGMDIHTTITDKAAKRKGVYPQIKRRFAGKWRYLQTIDGAEIRDIALSFGIADKQAIRWLQLNVKDYDHLGSLVAESLRFTGRKGEAVTRDILEAIGED